eukprot:1805240-Lingulodinium_polyedra.AAC.1
MIALVVKLTKEYTERAAEKKAKQQGKAKNPSKKQKATKHRTMGELPGSSILQETAQQWCPENATIQKDALNGRWRITFKGVCRNVPSVSRSWTNLGKDGEKLALQHCLEKAWAHYADFAGLQCPHNLQL